MKQIIINIDGSFAIPKEHRDSKVLTVRQRWKTEVHRGRSIMMYFRHAKLNQKPYLPEGFIEVNKERYRVVRWEDFVKEIR